MTDGMTGKAGMIDIYGIVQGPHTTPEMEDGEYVMIVVANVEGEMYYDFEIYSDDFNWMYEVQKHCISKMEPYEIKEEG